LKTSFARHVFRAALAMRADRAARDQGLTTHDLVATEAAGTRASVVRSGSERGMMKHWGWFFSWLAIGGCLTGCADDALLPDVGSKPKPPPAQGASTVTLQPRAPAPADKTCPVDNVATSPIPPVAAAGEGLDNKVYQHFIVDGEEGAAVSCSVVGSTTFTFSGSLSQSGRKIQITEGSFPSTKRIGTARIAITDPAALPSVLRSPDFCSVDATSASGGNLQVKPGSMWASFTCVSVEADPSDACAASGFFVLENCAQ
jgi:hypothetical protein